MADSTQVMNLAAGSRSGELEGLLTRSTIAMLLAADDRHYVDVNEAACKLLGMSRAELLQSNVDAITPAALRGRVPAMWDQFLSQGTMQGVYDLAGASGHSIRITFVAIARVLPGLHLSCLLTGRSAAAPGVLSQRERDVVVLAAQGLTSREIAERLSVSRATVETHSRNAVRRLSARNRTHAIALALTRGEIALPAAGGGDG
jgi:DNA-binding CsgD family transcriptional regulator